jgi:hypothetical protein
MKLQKKNNYSCMNEKDKELIKALAALLKKFKKMFHFGSAFFHHHPPTEEDKHINDVSHFAHKNVDFVIPETVNDATGENAIGAVLKKENLRDREN